MEQLCNPYKIIGCAVLRFLNASSEVVSKIILLYMPSGDIASEMLDTTRFFYFRINGFLWGVDYGYSLSCLY